MGIIFIAVADFLMVAAIYIQWKDCIRGYGNTMEVYSLIGTIWLLAGMCLGIGVSQFIPWYFGLGCGIVLYAWYYPMSSLVTKLGVKYGPRSTQYDKLERSAAVFAEEIRMGKWDSKLDKSIPVPQNKKLIDELKDRSPGFTRLEYENALSTGMCVTR